MLQGGIVLGGVLFFMLLIQIVKWTGLTVISGALFWVAAGTGLMIYSIFNSILSLSAPNMDQYWTRSTATYAVLMVCSGLLAYLFSQMTIKEAGSFKWIFMVLTFGYLLFLSMMRFMKKVVFWAQQEDDNWTKRMKGR